MRKTTLFLLGLLMVAACENKAYDTDNLILEGRVLENEISVPIGNVGPFTLELVTKSKTLSALLGGVMKTEEDGTIVNVASEDLYKINAYEIIARCQEKGQDLSQPFTYEIGDREVTPGGFAGLLESFGFWAVDKHVVITATDPLRESYTMGGNTHIRCVDKSTYQTSYEETFPLEGIVVKRLLGRNTLLEMTIPETVHNSPTQLGIKNGTLNLPGNMMRQIYSSSAADFVFSMDYTCHIAVGDKLSLPLSMFGLDKLSFNFNLPIEDYDFKDVEVCLDLENTLPFNVTLSNIQLMTGETPTVDENLLISPDPLEIKGGSLEKPATTSVALRIQALENTIPDITGVKAQLAIDVAPDYVGTVLSLKQGVTVKSASATLRGGVTLRGK